MKKLFVSPGFLPGSQLFSASSSRYYNDSSSSTVHITATYHPRPSSCCFSCSLQLFVCSSLATSTTATHSDKRAANFRGTKRTVPTRRFTRTIAHNTSVIFLEAKAKPLEAAQKTQRKPSRASTSPTHTREHPIATKLSLVPHRRRCPKLYQRANYFDTTFGPVFLFERERSGVA